MKIRFSLYTKILLWFFLNLIVLGAVLLVFFNFQFRLDPDSPMRGDSVMRIDTLAQLMSLEMADQTEEERNAILSRYSETYQVDFILYAADGRRLGGSDAPLPDEVRALMGRQFSGNSGRGYSRRQAYPRRRPPIFNVRTSNPTRYWVGVRVPIFETGSRGPTRATLLAVSDSISGHGLFFDPAPWAIMILIVLGLSALLWFPFVRSLTRTIKSMTAATEQIAEGKFDIRVDDARGDELGRLGRAINHLSTRLSGFVTGQKRFLGDISHELNSPLARMQFALGILEERTDGRNREYVGDAQEEVRHMSKLVSELLAYARAGLKSSEVELMPVSLREVVDQVIERETGGAGNIEISVADDLKVQAQPELLSRAIANLVRNSIRYAGDAGPIRVAAATRDDQIVLTVSDNGPGVPEPEVDRLFDPFYRLESHRSRETGGTGLGLAIVKTCIEACRGSVSARNLSPTGFEVEIVLKKSEY